MPKDKTVHVFTKGPFEEVRATISTYKGKRYASVRIYANYEGDKDNEEGYDPDEMSPTKKGITLKLKDVHSLKEAVDALFDAATQELAEEES